MPRHLLIADRDPLTLHLLQVTLDDPQYVIHYAQDSQAVLATALREKLNLIVLDMNVGGTDLARLLRRESPTRDVPLILLRPPGQEPLEPELAQCVSKPFSPLELLHLVSAMIES